MQPLLSYISWRALGGVNTWQRNGVDVLISCKRFTWSLSQYDMIRSHS